MKTLSWAIKIVLFLIALTFALKNTAWVTVRYYLGLQWQAPLIFVMLAAFFLGTLAGVMASFPYIARLRREVSSLRKKTVAVQAAESAAIPQRIADVP